TSSRLPTRPRRVRAPGNRRRGRRCAYGSCGSFRGCSCVVDPETCLEVEEMEGARVDGDLRRMPVAQARARAEAADDHRLGRAARLDLLHGALVADVLRELTYVIRQCLPRVDREVDHDLRAERLLEHDAAVEAPVLRRVR